MVLAAGRPAPGPADPPPLQYRSLLVGGGEAPGMRSAETSGLFSTAEKPRRWSTLLTTVPANPKASHPSVIKL